MGRVIELLPIIVWIWWSTFYSIKYFLLKNRVAGLDKPELWLTRKERRAYSRTQLARRDEQYIEQVYRQMVERPNQLKGEMREK